MIKTFVMKKLIAFFILFLGTITITMAQAPPPSGGSTVGAPIDDHIWPLAILVALFGAYKLVEPKYFSKLMPAKRKA